MDGEEKIYNLIERLYKELIEFKDETKDNFSKTNQAITKIEHDHGQKLAALFDGYRQNADKLDRIEAEVKRHDKFILERIK